MRVAVGDPEGVAPADAVDEADAVGGVDFDGVGESVMLGVGSAGGAGQLARLYVKYCDISWPRPSSPTAMMTSAEPTRAEHAAFVKWKSQLIVAE